MSSNGVEAWFAAAAEGQRPTLEALRELILTVAPEVTEEIKWGRPCYSNARGLVCYLHHTKSYATLGFYKGAELDDPEGLLEGTGKTMRHVKVRSLGDEEAAAYTALVSAAAAR